MSEDGRRLLLAGLQETGKTSFLALFYLLLVEGTGSLRLANYQADREHLNRVSKRLMEFSPPSHTEVGERGQLALALQIGNSEERVELRIPDLSGETWEEAIKERRWDQDIEEQVSSSESVLLFTTTKRFDPGTTIGEMNQALQGLGGEKPEKAPVSTDPKKKTVVLDGQPPTDVQLVDLLQLTVEQRGGRPVRACILVSAWDENGSDISPGQYVVENMPLLRQYLDTNKSWLSARIFGVSAQGCSFDNVDEGLRSQGPLERAFVLSEDGLVLPIDAPITWALAIDGI